ncbi:glycosyltransferase [Enterococcus hulanensis]|uniref:glycosyltransferase n=1 Tax=Enterococcus hulanensis TaxID=2559929 RepID=UPI0010F45924|nr:glycosyltransferase [Enterococcus hulanensis]
MTCFIVLHYVVREETISCVNSLQRLVGEKKIIIVDNASPNNSGKELENFYSDVENVDVILLNKNVGFANGNNAGYTHARENYHPETIVIMNNDIQIEQSNFISKIKDIYLSEKYAVLGPDVFATSLGIHQSPKRLDHYTLEEVQSLVNSYEKKQKNKKLTKLKCYLKRLGFLKRFVYNRRIRNSAVDHNRVYYNVPLHGSCIIFSEIFINKREKAFFDGTFMYYESEILDYECQINGLKSIYTPELQVLHNHNVSTNETFKSDIKRTEFMNECILDSLTSFLCLIKEK